MVRRGSTVRVRQRALQKPRTSGFCVQADLQVGPYAVGMEPFMELSRRERASLAGSVSVSAGGESISSQWLAQGETCSSGSGSFVRVASFRPKRSRSGRRRARKSLSSPEAASAAAPESLARWKA